MSFENKNQWLKEFMEFSDAEVTNVNVPENLLQSIRRRVFPNPWGVFAKIAGLHLIVGGFSLAICDQFGLNPFRTSQPLTGWFMSIGGHQLCMVFCGMFFMASTYILANLFLSLEELEALRRYEWLQLGGIGLFSLAAFYFFGAQLVVTLTLLWLVGAILGGFISLEGSYRVRRSEWSR